ncbi:chaperone NapD [Aquabacterium olei]|nr:chaperone NapD [Aquabacterium olei]
MTRKTQAVDEIHIAGVIVHTRQPHTVAACSAMDALEGMDVAQFSPEGRVVAVVEAPSAGAVMDLLDQVRGIEGVLNVALVYQHAEPADAMNEEMGP